MRTKLISGLVILGSLFFAQTLFGNKDGFSGNLSVRQKFDTELSNLKKNLSLKTDKQEQWKQFTKFENQVTQLRKKNPRQIEGDEVHMNYLMDAVSIIPRGSNFKKEKCPAYQAQIIQQFDPQNGEAPDSPVAPALSVLEILCK
jgi:hypothetical protein